MPLTDTRIRTTKPGASSRKLTDAGGLYLEVRPSGSRLWRYRYRIDGKENVFALGEYAQTAEGETKEQTRKRIESGRLTLAEARTARDDARGLVKHGIHPAHSRQALRAAQVSENANTFEAISREWIAQQRVNWSAYYLSQVESFMQADVYPYAGPLPIRQVNAAKMLDILQRVEKRAPSVAALLRQWCSAVFRYAVATLRADADPVAALKGALSKPKVQHRKPLSRSDIPRFLRTLDETNAFRTTTIALKLLLLTFVRPGELRGAEWVEFDLKRSEWRIPAERMKMHEEHIVPLSTQALDLLRELHTLTGGQRWLFPNYRRPAICMTNTTLNRALERMSFNGKDTIGFSAHGFRATASTMLNEMGFRSDLIERQLAHAERDTSRKSYNRAQYLGERHQMMQTWADYLDALAAGDKVVPGGFNRAAA